MKKIYAVLLVAFIAVILSACASKEAWLKGTWTSNQTNSKYEFKEESGKWTILSGESKIAEDLEVKDRKDSVVNLVDDNGIRYQVEKKDKDTIHLEIFNSDGLSATNGQGFEFKKDQ